MRVISKTGASSVKNPATGEVFDADSDGVFDLPHEYGWELTKKHASQWCTETEQQAAARRSRLAKLGSPKELVSTIATLIDRVNGLETSVAELRAASGRPATAPPAASGRSGRARAGKTEADASE